MKHYLCSISLIEMSLLIRSGSVRALCIHSILLKVSKKTLLLIGQKTVFGGGGYVEP